MTTHFILNLILLSAPFISSMEMPLVIIMALCFWSEMVGPSLSNLF